MAIKIHFITGSKGNVGKSAWAEALVAFYTSQKRKLTLIDGDKDVPALTKTHPDAKPIAFSDNPAHTTQPDTITELAYAESKKKKGADLLIDLPGGGERFLNEWMDDCSLDSLAETYGFELIKWWVSDSDADSIKLFQHSVKKYPRIRHVFLKNLGKSFKGQWEAFDGDKSLQKLLKSKNVAVLEIPTVNPLIITTLRVSGITLTEVIKDKEFQITNIGTNLRVKTWVARTGLLAERVLSFDTPAQDVAGAENPSQDVVETNQSEAVATSAT